MQKKLLLSVLAVALLIGGGVLVWQKKMVQEKDKNQLVMEQSSTQTTQPVIVNDLLTQAEKIQLPTVDTTGWRTYRDEKYGFEIKYPKEWKVLDGSDDHEIARLISPETSKNTKAGEWNGIYPIDISIGYYSSVEEGPENFEKATTLETMIDQNSHIRKIGNIYLGGEPAVEVAWGGYGVSYSILTVHNKHLYIVGFLNREDKSQLTDEEKVILSTIVFW